MIFFGKESKDGEKREIEGYCPKENYSAEEEGEEKEERERKGYLGTKSNEKLRLSRHILSFLSK